MRCVDWIPSERASIRRELAALVIAACATVSASGQATELVRLNASNGAAFDYYGEAVDISGNVIVVGSRLADRGGKTDSGVAYVYRFDGTTWVEEKELNPSATATSDYFGYSVSVDGNLIAVGAYGDDDPASGTDTGSCYIFRHNGTTWVEEQKLVPSTARGSDLAGVSVDVSGDVVVVGAYGHDGASADTGSAFVFRYKGSFIKWQEERELTSNAPGTSDNFGEYVAIDGNVVVVGAPKDDETGIGVDVGSACVFRYSGGSWNFENRFANPNPNASDLFGQTVDVHGDRIVIAASHDDVSGADSGTAYLYEWNGSAWVQVHQFIPSSGGVSDQLGYGAKIGDDAIVVSSHIDDVSFTDTGSAHLFRRCRDGTWIEDHHLVSSSRNTGDHFGREISIDGDRIVVGAVLDDDKGADSGSAFVFGAADLELDIEPNTATAGTLVTFSMYYGNPSDLGLLALFAVNNVPVFIPIYYAYAPNHQCAIANVPMPSGIPPGTTFDFIAFENNNCGDPVASNVERLTFF